MPIISVVIPTYNRPDLLKRLLTSIADQTFSDYEVIVVDDNSHDSESYQAVINSFSPILSLTYIRNPENKGAPFSRNKGIRVAGGDYIALVDDDDEWLPDKLQKQLDLFIQSKSSLGIVYTWADTIDDSSQNVVYQYRANIRGHALKEILNECFIPSPTIMVKRSIFGYVGFFDESFPSCQDWDMWTRILAHGYECDVVEESLAIHHKHARHSIGNFVTAKEGYWKYYKKHYTKYINHNLHNLLKIRLNGIIYYYKTNHDIWRTFPIYILKAKVALLITFASFKKL